MPCGRRCTTLSAAMSAIATTALRETAAKPSPRRVPERGLHGNEGGATLGRRVGMAILAVVLVIGGAYAVAGDTPSLVVVETGPEDSVSSAWAAGEPVWVIHSGEDVVVLNAVNPHPWWGIDELVGWCESVRGLQSWWDGSRFD